MIVVATRHDATVTRYSVTIRFVTIVRCRGSAEARGISILFGFDHLVAR